MNYFNKNNIFSELSKTQKSSLLVHLKLFVKKHSDLNVQSILDEFIEEEYYYQEVGNPNFEWIFEHFEKDSFVNDIKNYIHFLLFNLEQKEKQKPFLEEQKKRAKEIKKQAQEFKMSKMPPTSKQIYYYEKLCKNHNIQMVETKNLSRLDLKNLINKILEETK